MARIRPSTQAQFHVQTSLASGEFYFTTFSGITDQAGTTTYADGQVGRIFQLRTAKTIQAFTISTPFDPIIHKPLVDAWLDYQCQPISITVTPVGCGESQSRLENSPQLIINDAQVTSLKFLNVDRAANNVSMIELGFVADTYTYNV